MGDVVYAVVTFTSVGAVDEMEFLDEPPLWFLEPLNQKCFIGNINGGDTAPYDNMLDLIAKAHSEGVSVETWTDAHGNTVKGKYEPPQPNGRHAAKPYEERLRDKGFLA